MADEPDIAGEVQVTTLDCGVGRQLRWIWFLPYGGESGRLVRLPTAIPDLAEYLRYWRSTLRRSAHQAEARADG